MGVARPVAGAGLKILIDALTAREGGGVTYIRQIVPALARAAAGRHELLVLLSGRYQRELADALPAGARAVLADVPADQVRRLWYEQVRLPTLVRREGVDVLYTVNEVGAVRPGCPHVVMARNLNVYQAPDAAPSGTNTATNPLPAPSIAT